MQAASGLCSCSYDRHLDAMLFAIWKLQNCLGANQGLLPRRMRTGLPQSATSQASGTSWPDAVGDPPNKQAIRTAESITFSAFVCQQGAFFGYPVSSLTTSWHDSTSSRIQLSNVQSATSLHVHLMQSHESCALHACEPMSFSCECDKQRLMKTQRTNEGKIQLCRRPPAAAKVVMEMGMVRIHGVPTLTAQHLLSGPGLAAGPTHHLLAESPEQAAAPTERCNVEALRWYYVVRFSTILPCTTHHSRRQPE